MKELAKHIHQLLQENDCVIVPGFGGFIAHHNPATWIEKDNTFLPPSREIAFNPLLKINDGLLAQSYMTSYHTSFSDATKRIDSAVKQLVRSLFEDGTVYLPEIGELRFNIHHSYEFRPEDEKIITPSLYGLSSFELSTLEEVQQQRIAAKQLEAKQREEEERKRREAEFKRQEEERLRAMEEKRLAEEELRRQEAGERARIKVERAAERTLSRRRTLRRTLNTIGTMAAMIAILFLCFTFATPLENTTIGTENYAELNPKELLNNLMNHSLITQPVGESSEAMAPVEQTLEVETAPVIEVQVPKIYHVIVASVGASSDAERMAQELTQKGYKDAKAIIGGGYNRVCIGSFETEQEAYSMVRQLKTDNVYQQSWVLKRQ